MLNEMTTKTYEDFSYAILENNEIIIRQYMGYDSNPIIPAEIENRPVTTLGKNSFMTAPVETITIPESITTIEDNAFAVCDDLQEVYLPCSLVTMGRGVFQGSESIRKVSISNESNNYRVVEGILYDRNECRVVFCPPALQLEKVVVPYGTLTIADSAFYANNNLKYVELPLTLQKIEHGAFLFTSSLPIINLPPHLKEIESGAFLMGSGPYAEKRFEIYAFPDTVGFRYAVENRIPVHPLYAIVY